MPGPVSVVRNKPSPPNRIFLNPFTISAWYVTVSSKAATLPVSTLILSPGANILSIQLPSISINTLDETFKNDMDKSRLSEQVNIIACKEIARLLYIKNIKKMVIIDYLRMQDERAKKNIEESLRQEFKKLNVKTQIFGFTKMGLFEIIIQ